MRRVPITAEYDAVELVRMAAVLVVLFAGAYAALALFALIAYAIGTAV